MKLKKTFIALILLISILTIASVSANEDNNITQNGIMGNENSFNEIMSEYSPTQDDNETPREATSADENQILGNSDYDDTYENEYYYDQNIGIYLYSQNIAKGNPVIFYTSYKLEGCFEVQIDGKNATCTYDCQEGDDMSLEVDTTGIDIGKHEIFLKCTKKEYEHLSENYTIYIDNIIVEVPDRVELDDYKRVTAILPRDATGTVTIKIDGKTVYKEDCNYTHNHFIILDYLKVPTKDYVHKISVSYSGDENYSKYYKEFNLTADYPLCKNKTFIYGNYIYGQSHYEYVISEYDGLNKSKLSVTIDGVKYTKIINNVDYHINLPGNFAIGNHSVVVTYLGDKNYYAKTETATIEIVPIIDIDPVYDWSYGKAHGVSLTLPKNAKGSLTVFIDGVKYKSTKLTNGKATISMKYAKPGKYNITATYDGDDYYVETESVIKNIRVDYQKGSEVSINKKVPIYVYGAKTLEENLLINFNGKNYTGKADGDNLVFTLPKINKVGYYYFDMLYIKNNKIVYNETGYFKVNPKYEIPSIINKGNGSLTISSNEDANVTVIIDAMSEWDDEKITLQKKLVNGTATFSLNKLKEGEYQIETNYVSQSNENTEFFYIYVVTNKLMAKDLTKYYGSSKTFNVKVTDLKGNIVKNKYVNFLLNGKYIKKVKTNAKGYASININPAPGKYKITAEYRNAEVTKNFIVKHVLKLGKITVKKSAKNLVLKASLKQGKKALSYKSVTFKFLGKNYKIKTNKNGIAKLTISKKILKKLTVGKTIVYQATYKKDTIKQSAIVKK